MDDGTMKMGSGLEWGVVRSGTVEQVEKAMKAGRGKTAGVGTEQSAPAAAAGNENLGLLKAAMGAFEAAWSKDAIADM